MRAFWQRKRRVDPDEFAQAAMTEFVDNPSLPVDAAELFESPPGERYQAHMRLYRGALVLMVILNAEHSDARWLSVQTSFERLIFTMPAEEGMPVVQDLRTAMVHLRELLTMKRGSPAAAQGWRWAMAWFQAIGMDEVNPARLTRFVLAWMDAYIELSDMMQEVRPA